MIQGKCVIVLKSPMIMTDTSVSPGCPLCFLHAFWSSAVSGLLLPELRPGNFLGTKLGQTWGSLCFRFLRFHSSSSSYCNTLKNIVSCTFPISVVVIISGGRVNPTYVIFSWPEVKVSWNTIFIIFFIKKIFSVDIICSLVYVSSTSNFRICSTGFDLGLLFIPDSREIQF